MTHDSRSLVEENGAHVLWAVAIPAMLAAVALALSVWPARLASWFMFGVGALALLYALFIAVSIGPFFLPVALLLLIAAYVHTAARRNAA